MQIAYISSKPTEKVHAVLSEHSSKNRLNAFKTISALEESVENGSRFQAIVVQESRITCEMMSQIDQVLASQPKSKLILISDFAEVSKNVSLHPISFLSETAAEEYLGTILKESTRAISPKDSDVLLIRWNKVLYTILKRDILYLERNARNTFIFTKDRTLRCTATVDDLEKELPDYFGRCHKSYLVNMYEIQKVSRTEILMKNGTEIPISRNRYFPFLEKYEDFLSHNYLDQPVPRRYLKRNTREKSE